MGPGQHWTVGHVNRHARRCGGDLFVATTFYQNQRGSLFRSSDNGTTWNPVSTGYMPGFPGSDVTAVAGDGTNLFLGMAEMAFSFPRITGTSGLRSAAELKCLELELLPSWAQMSWQHHPQTVCSVPQMVAGHGFRENAGLRDGFLQAVAVNGGDIFLGGFNGLHLSTDAGDHWTSVGSDLMFDITALAILDPYVYANRPGVGVFRSSDRGENWIQVNDGLTDKYIVSLAVLGTDLFAAGDGVYRSTNGGDTWTPASNGLMEQYCHHLCVMGSDLYVGAGEGLFLSTNSGADWTPINASLPYSYAFPYAVSGPHLFVANGDNSLFRTSNQGTTWIPIDQGLNATTIASLAVVGPDLYLGTWGEGIWKRPLSEVTSIEPGTEKCPQSFRSCRATPTPSIHRPRSAMDFRTALTWHSQSSTRSGSRWPTLVSVGTRRQDFTKSVLMHQESGQWRVSVPTDCGQLSWRQRSSFWSAEFTLRGKQRAWQSSPGSSISSPLGRMNWRRVTGYSRQTASLTPAVSSVYFG